jgi:hypothetical protein
VAAQQLLIPLIRRVKSSHLSGQILGVPGWQASSQKYADAHFDAAPPAPR